MRRTQVTSVALLGVRGAVLPARLQRRRRERQDNHSLARRVPVRTGRRAAVAVVAENAASKSAEAVRGP